ncbi:hypothetical protein EI42_06350 [Thermosporothrix hazakensis]|uniref:Uncharacterized protein n=1 Tax=Thermosporothrix hazakensis TaxID=644383 RepID=A0A326TP11_THEHA|nr:hypothetical protein EI42_06350 [Thermosporothrix hazakensis]GCE50684.1 hypothetical protein KTH_55530 [Thermosporothrix hazakensis]
MIAVEEQPTARTQMRTHTQALLDSLSTTRTVLTGEGRFHPDHWNTMQRAVVFHPPEEATSRRIRDAPGQMAVLDEMADLQGFVGNHVVRRDKRVRLLSRDAVSGGTFHVR